MNDIFVSYDDLDRARVHRLVEALEARGWSVWWDHHISAGDSFSLVIERELEAAACVVVVWTRTSVESDWVRAEANEGWKRGKLVPVLLDRVTPPMPFGQIHAADLVDWKERGHSGFAKLIADLHERIGSAPGPRPRAAATATAGGSRKGLAVGAGAILLLALVSAYLIASVRPGADARGVEAARTDSSMDTRLPGGAGGAEMTDASAGGSAAAAFAGHWQAAVTYPDGATFDERFTFDVVAGELSGTASLRGYGNRRGILDGAVEGSRLSFRTRGEIQLDLFTVREVVHLYRGAREGDTIRFSVVEEGSGDPAFTFAAHRISAEQASRVATGGRRPRLGGMSTNGLYTPDHVRAVVGSGQRAMTGCYEAAEFDEVRHEFVSYDLTVAAGGVLEQMEMRPVVASLEGCMRDVLAALPWGPTETGEGGTLQINVDARLPWNP